MKTSASMLLLVLFIAGPISAAVNPPALDTTIRVLVLRDTSVSQTIVNQRIAFLEQTWSSTAGIGPVTLTIANPGSSIPLPLPQGGAQTQIDIARLLVNAPILPGQPSFRELFAADIAVLVTDEATVDGAPTCGLADGGVIGKWAGPTASFQPDAQGVDKRGSQDAWIGLLTTQMAAPNCLQLKGGAAHEVGHLMGGGHFLTPDPGTEPLNANARAWRAHVNLPALGMNHTYRTSLTGPNACVSGSICFEVAGFSNSTNFGDASHQNALTVAQTALSVANYFSGDPVPSSVAQCADGMDNDGDALVDTADPDCTGPTDDDETGPPPTTPPPGCNPLSFPPANVSASLTYICDSTLTYSIYRLRWNDACPGDSYLIQANQGFGTYTVGTVFGFSTPLYISGSPGAITVRSCVGFSCSAQSNPPVFIFDQC